MKRYTDYEPETVGEEFMLLLGRVEALGIYLEMEKGNYVDRKIVAAIMGIEIEEKEKESPRKEIRASRRSL